MLKTLRMSSLAITVFTLFTFVTIIVFGFKDDSKVNALLQKPGIVEKIRGDINQNEPPNGTDSPLVTQAKAFALRIDPPVILPQEEKITRVLQEKQHEKTEKGRELIEENQPKSLMFNLLATVRYVSAPEKSLALFQSGGRQEWFYRGQTVGRHEIEEIKDGSVLLIQPGQKLQEVMVPAKSTGQSLLKDG